MPPAAPAQEVNATLRVSRPARLSLRARNGKDTLASMRVLWRRILAMSLAAAFVAGTVTVAFAAGIDPCDRTARTETGHEHQRHHHDKIADTQSCFACPCCLALSAAAVDSLPQAPQQIAYVVYLDRTRSLIGRSIPPDILPPRPIAAIPASPRRG